jgi:predicted nucleic acid-binding protein
MPGSFFDTNVLLYIASDDMRKAEAAERLIEAGGSISVQVLNELANVCRRKARMSWPETEALLSDLRALLAVVPVGIEVHETGLALAKRFDLSLYDAMIAAAALQSDCDTLWSEDMQHGMKLGRRLRVENPFRGIA